MDSRLVFIYDGECPFCNHFAELLELKSGFANIQIKDARNNPHEIPSGYDMDEKGAILIKDQEFLHGPKAIHWICSNITKPSDPLLKVLSYTFSSNQRTKFFFPLLLILRRIYLFIKGVPRKLIFTT